MDLPDIFLGRDGCTLHAPSQWPAQRRELLAPLLSLQYGALPAAPPAVSCLLRHSAATTHFGGARLLTYRIAMQNAADAPVHQMAMQVWRPPDAPNTAGLPVLLSGDACWHYATDAVLAEVMARGYALAQFNRVELVADVALEPAAPALPAALAIWAWGYHRCVDALLQLDWVNPGQIAIVGHSRGGKAALLAGATDERIALTSANNSGAGGAGSWRVRGQGAETLRDIVRAFPQWFSPRLAEFAGKEQALPFDQHWLLALIAPRALFTTEALGDLWANPEGTRCMYAAAREAWHFLGAGQRIATHWREGGHAHSLSDWCALLDFADVQFGGKSAGFSRAFQQMPPP